MSNDSSGNPDELSSGGSRYHQVYPTLDERQLAILERYGERRKLKADDILYSEGDRHIAMFAILSGTIEATRASVQGPQLLGTHGPGSFTGEVGTLAGRAAAATTRAVSDCEVIVIDEESLRALVIAEAELSETIMRAYILRRVAFIQGQHAGVVVIGSTASAPTLHLRHFLSRNGQPSAYFDIVEHAETKELLTRYGATEADIPIVVTLQGTVLRRPSNRTVADAIGLSPDRLNGARFDLVVVGAGPAGLAAAVYAASEGLKVVVLDAKAPGGQAGTSSKIENYFGFPTGVSGQALAGRGLSQCRKFGAEVGVPIEALTIECADAQSFQIGLDHDEGVHARAVVIATGARYRTGHYSPGAFRGSRHLLQRNIHGGCVLQQPRVDCGWRWKFGRTGCGIPCEVRTSCSCRYSRRRTQCKYVGLFDQADQRGSQHHASHEDNDRRVMRRVET